MSNGQIAAILVGIIAFVFVLGLYVGLTAPSLGH